MRDMDRIKDMWNAVIPNGWLLEAAIVVGVFAAWAGIDKLRKRKPPATGR